VSHRPEEIEALATRFATWGPFEFNTSPLYQALGPWVADDQVLLELMTERIPGQQPTNLFFAALHYLVLSQPDHPLANFFPSVVGAAAEDPVGSRPSFQDFCAVHFDELAALIRTRLVQTNVLKRSAALRLALATIAEQVEAVHLVEVGSSAGIHLLQDRWRYRLNESAVFGDLGSSVEIETKWRGSAPLPDLDSVPHVIDVLGIDLHPVDLRSAEDRRWLRSLVWPENTGEAHDLEMALDIVAIDPPRLVAGDAIDICERLDTDLARYEARVIFHAATLAHVPPDRREAFADAVAATGRSAPLFVVSLEGARQGEPRLESIDPYHLLTVRRPDGGIHHVAFVEGHGDWIVPID
jgi:hypothetical protein